MPEEIGKFDVGTVVKRAAFVGSGENGGLNKASAFLHGLDIPGILHVEFHGAHTGPSANGLQPFDGLLRTRPARIPKHQHIRYGTRHAQRGVVFFECYPPVSQYLVCKFVGFEHLAVQHGDYPGPLAGKQHLLESGNGRTLGRVGRFQHIVAAQVVEKNVCHTHGLFNPGIIRSIAHGAVDGAVVHHYHLLVERVLHIHLDGRIAVAGSHLNAIGAVFGDEILPVGFAQPAAAVSDGSADSFRGGPGETLSHIIVGRSACLKHYQACDYNFFHAFKMGLRAAVVSSGRPMGALCGAPCRMSGSSAASSAILCITAMNSSRVSSDSVSVGSIIRA